MSGAKPRRLSYIGVPVAFENPDVGRPRTFDWPFCPDRRGDVGPAGETRGSDYQGKDPQRAHLACRAGAQGRGSVRGLDQGRGRRVPRDHGHRRGPARGRRGGAARGWIAPAGSLGHQPLSRRERRRLDRVRFDDQPPPDLALVREAETARAVRQRIRSALEWAESSWTICAVIGSLLTARAHPTGPRPGSPTKDRS